MARRCLVMDMHSAHNGLDLARDAQLLRARGQCQITMSSIADPMLPRIKLLSVTLPRRGVNPQCAMAETDQEHSQQLVALTSRLLVSRQRCSFALPRHQMCCYRNALCRVQPALQ